jgi:hypothetical protein
VSQTRRGSFIESIFNILIGYGIAVISQVIIFPWFGIYIPLHANFQIGGWFTLVSLIRSYAIRRWFNARLHKFAQTLAGK